MKTKRYTIQFDYLDQMGSSEMVISKKEWDRQFKELSQQQERSENEDYEFSIEMNKYVKDFQTHTQTTYVFRSGCATVWLAQYECKTGYKFKNR